MGNLVVGSLAITSGALTRHELRTGYRRIYRNVYLPVGVELTARVRAEAAFLWSGGSGLVCGISAAAMYGNPWISADRPAELIREWRSAPKGIILHADTLCPDESTVIDGLRSRRRPGRCSTSVVAYIPLVQSNWLTCFFGTARRVK